MGFEPMYKAFAEPCLTTWPRRHDSLIVNHLAGHDDGLSKTISCQPFESLSGRWDSNPRPSPWQGDVLPLYYARVFGR